MNKNINPNLRKLAELTYNPDLKVDESILEEQKKKLKEEEIQKRKPKNIKLPKYFEEKADSIIEKDKALVRLGSYTESGCSGTETRYTIEIEGKTNAGSGFSYLGRFDSTSERKEDLNKKKKDLEKLVGDIIVRED